MNVSLHLKRSAGLALGGLLISASLCGCQTTVGGQTLPSAHYLEDDIQYFPAYEEFLLPNTQRAHQEYKAARAGDAAEVYNPVQ
jgi:hypothetical protein